MNASSLHLLPETDEPTATCKACGRLIIKSDEDDAPKFMTDEDKYWRMQSDVRCAPPKPGEGKQLPPLAHGSWK